jgi:hypothetical protein
MFAEQSLRNMRDLLKDEEKFNDMILTLYRSIPREQGLDKRALMILISDAIDIGN